MSKIGNYLINPKLGGQEIIGLPAVLVASIRQTDQLQRVRIVDPAALGFYPNFEVDLFPQQSLQIVPRIGRNTLQ